MGMGVGMAPAAIGAANAPPPKYLQWSAADPARAHVLGARAPGAGAHGGCEHAAASSAAPSWAANAWAEVPVVAGHVGGAGCGGAAAAANMPLVRIRLGLPDGGGRPDPATGGPIGVGVGDPLAMDAELGLLLDAPGDGLVMDGGLL